MQGAVYEPGGWNLELSQQACERGHNSGEKGAFIGNGKLGMFAEFVGGGVQTSMIAGEFKTFKGVYKSNTINTFRTCKWCPFSMDDAHLQVYPVMQRLNMKTGILTSENVYMDVRIEDNNTLTISSDLYALRQFPYCTVQTLRVTCPWAIESTIDAMIYNKIECSSEMSNVDFNYNVIDVDNPVSKTPLSMMTGKGVSDGTNVAFASCIIFEDQNAGHSLLGFNCYKDDPRKAYVKVNLKNIGALVPVRVHCLTIHMTDFDFEDPFGECKMVLLSILNRSPLLSLNLVQRLREDHVNMWAKLWKSDIVLKPRSGNFVASTREMNSLSTAQRHLRQNLYLVYSSTRDNIQVEVNPSTFGILDAHNTTMYDGDLFLVPLLMYVMPSAVKSLLEYRYNQLSVSTQLAASYGYTGAKFPYTNDVMGYRNALYWDAKSPMYLFNNALIALNVWNYYRITVDREWLANKGYAILKSCVEFLVSRCEVDNKGVYHLRDVLALNMRPSNDNSFTNNLVKLATKALIEASYELAYPVKKEWVNIMTKLQVNVARAGLQTYEVVLYEGASTPESVLDEEYDIVEPLFVTSPMMSDLYFIPGSNRGFDCLKRSYDFYKARVSASYHENILNIALFMSTCASMNKYNPLYVTEFMQTLDEFTAKYDTVWGMETCTTKAAILPLVFINAVAGVNIQGGVAETRFYYEEMTIKGLYANHMPRYWDNIMVTNAGPVKKSFIVYNQNLEDIADIPDPVPPPPSPLMYNINGYWCAKNAKFIVDAFGIGYAYLKTVISYKSMYLAENKISVDFGPMGVLTGVLQGSLSRQAIKWSNGTTWTRTGSTISSTTDWKGAQKILGILPALYDPNKLFMFNTAGLSYVIARLDTWILDSDFNIAYNKDLKCHQIICKTPKIVTLSVESFATLLAPTDTTTLIGIMHTGVRNDRSVIIAESSISYGSSFTVYVRPEDRITLSFSKSNTANSVIIDKCQLNFNVTAASSSVWVETSKALAIMPQFYDSPL